MTSLGNAIGSYGTGVMTDRFGYRYSQAAGCAISLGFVCLQVFAVNREMILFGKLLNGIVSLTPSLTFRLPLTHRSPWACLWPSPLATSPRSAVNALEL